MTTAEREAHAEARHIAYETPKAGAGVRPAETEPAQASLDGPPVCADETVDARAGGLEQESVGEARAPGLDVVPL